MLLQFSPHIKYLEFLFVVHKMEMEMEMEIFFLSYYTSYCLYCFLFFCAMKVSSNIKKQNRDPRVMISRV